MVGIRLALILRRCPTSALAITVALAFGVALLSPPAAHADDTHEGAVRQQRQEAAQPDAGQAASSGQQLPAGRVRVIVSLEAPAVSLGEGAGRTLQLNRIQAIQDDVLARLPASARATLQDRFRAVPALVMEVDAAAVAPLEALPGVRSVMPDVAEPPLLDQGRALIRADQVHALGFTGQGVTVAVIDTGVDIDHPDLSSSLVGGMCFARGADGQLNGVGDCPGGTDSGTGLASAQDINGHGTHVSGIITGDGVVAPRGVAPAAQVFSYQVFSVFTDGVASYQSDQLRALDDILLNRPEVRAVNMSLGGGASTGRCDTDARAQVFAALRSRGTLVVVASGNGSFTNAMSTPACISDALAVGAVDDSGAVSSFSNSTGSLDASGQPLLDLLAPGRSITAPYNGGGSATLNGTSMAAPHATGAVALLLSANGALTAAQVEAQLESTGVPTVDGRNGSTTTTPRVDVYAAVTSTPCSAVSLSVSPTAPQAVGTTLNFTAAASGCMAAEYRFWHELRNGTWELLRDWGASGSLGWSTTGQPVGAHRVDVHARAVGSGGAAQATQPLTGIMLGTPCTSVSLGASPASPQTLGATVTFAASASGCTAGTPEYRFWHQRPDGSWSLARDWASSTTFAWDTGTEPTGTHRIDVHARQQGGGEAEATQPLSGYQLTAPAPCTSAGITPGAPSPQEVGSSVTFTATAAGCATPEYRFWRQRPDGSWLLARDWATGATLAWDTAGEPAGSHRIDVHARARFSGGAAQATQPLLGYELTVPVPCSSVSLSPGAASPQQVGAVVTFTASAGGCTTPEYQFWHQRPDGTWWLAQDWSTLNTLAWNTAGEPVGTHRIDAHARARSSGGAAQATQPFTGYELTAAVACTAAGLSSDLAPPQAVGATVTFTASASGCTAPEYRFWHQRPDGSWLLARDWSTSATFVWATAGEPPGTHRFDVHARHQGGVDTESAAPMPGWQLTP